MIIDVFQYGFLGLNNTASEWNGTTLPPPILNISAFYLPIGGDLYGGEWRDPRTNELPFQNLSHWAYAVMTAVNSDGIPSTLNEVFYYPDIQENGVCQPVKDVCLILSPSWLSGLTSSKL